MSNNMGLKSHKFPDHKPANEPIKDLPCQDLLEKETSSK